jgi:uncharacterized protein
MNNEYNPFLISGYKDEDSFCDRRGETLLLTKHIKNNINTTLFAIRRIGKTGLIQHLFFKLQKNKKVACIYVDIYATQDLKSFTNTLATAIYKRFPEKKGVSQSIIDFIKKLRPVISYDQLTGSPEISIELNQAKQYERTIQQIFQFLDAQKIHVVFAIDEFQQITTYPEKNTEALLRTYIQTLHNVSFIFCGSNQKIMHEMFNNAKRPFYASCTNMNLNFIITSEYTQFIVTQFKKHKRTITAEAVDYILTWTFRHTFYTQYVCNQLFASGIKKITLDDVFGICQKVLEVHEGTYYQYRNLLTKAQWDLLKAIAHEETISKLHSKDFLKKYQLGTTSTISRSIESLLEKELLHKELQQEQTTYSINDKFLMRWLQRK